MNAIFYNTNFNFKNKYLSNATLIGWSFTNETLYTEEGPDLNFIK